MSLEDVHKTTMFQSSCSEISFVKFHRFLFPFFVKHVVLQLFYETLFSLFYTSKSQTPFH